MAVKLSLTAVIQELSLTAISDSCHTAAVSDSCHIAAVKLSTTASMSKDCQQYGLECPYTLGIFCKNISYVDPMTTLV